MAERRAVNADVEGSSPSEPAMKHYQHYFFFPPLGWYIKTPERACVKCGLNYKFLLYDKVCKKKTRNGMQKDKRFWTPKEVIKASKGALYLLY